jgi:hypothetical protein
MEGQAVADLDGKDYNGGKGTLAYLLNDPGKAALVRHLRTAQGVCTVRESVWVRYQPEQGPLQAGPLTVGYTLYADKHHFGPELQFGHVIGDHCGGQVLGFDEPRIRAAYEQYKKSGRGEKTLLFNGKRTRH